MPVSNVTCEGKHHVFSPGAELCRCGAFRVFGLRGMVKTDRPTPPRLTAPDRTEES